MSEDQTNAASTATGRPLAAAGPLRLQVIGTSRNGQIVEVASSRVTIGSGPQCTLRLRAPGVEPFHCLIVREPAGTFARALSGETLLNGEKFREEPLQSGDRLRVGCVELQICASTTRPPNSAQPSMTAPRPRGNAPNLDQQRLQSDELLERIERIEDQLKQLRASEESRSADETSSTVVGLATSTADNAAPPRPAFDEEMARLVQERQDLASQLENAKAQHDQARETISQLEYERDELLRRCETQDSEAEQARADYDRDLSGERLSRVALGSQLEELVSKVTELESQSDALQRELAFAQSAVDTQRSETEYCQAELERTRTEVLQWQMEANRWEEYARCNEEEVSRFQAEIETVRLESDRWRTDAQQREQAVAQLRIESEQAQRTIQRLQHEEEHRRGQLELLQADAALAQQELAQVLADAEHDQQEATNWCARAEHIQQEARRWKRAAKIHRFEALRGQKTVAELRAEVERWRAIAEINRVEAERCQAVAEKSPAEADEPKAASANSSDAAAMLLPRRREELAWLTRQFARAEVDPPPAATESFADSPAERNVDVNEDPVALEIDMAEPDVARVEPASEVSAPVLELVADPDLESRSPLAIAESELEDGSDSTVVEYEVEPRGDEDHSVKDEPNDTEDVLARLSRAGIWRDGELTDDAASTGESESSDRDEGSLGTRPILELVEEPEAEEGLELSGDDDSIENYMERLLQRVRGKHGESVIVPLPSRDPERRPVTEAELDLEPTVEPSEPAPLTESEYMPRSQAPEITFDLKALREIGNERRQKDILSHAQRTYSNKTRGKFVGSVLGVAVACSSYFYLQTYPEFAAVGLVAGSGIALYWLLRAYRFRRQLFDSLRLNTEELHGKGSGKVEE